MSCRPRAGPKCPGRISVRANDSIFPGHISLSEKNYRINLIRNFLSEKKPLKLSLAKSERGLHAVNRKLSMKTPYSMNQRYILSDNTSRAPSENRRMVTSVSKSTNLEIPNTIPAFSSTCPDVAETDVTELFPSADLTHMNIEGSMLNSKFTRGNKISHAVRKKTVKENKENVFLKGDNLVLNSSRNRISSIPILIRNASRQPSGIDKNFTLVTKPCPSKPINEICDIRKLTMNERNHKPLSISSQNLKSIVQTEKNTHSSNKAFPVARISDGESTMALHMNVQVSDGESNTDLPLNVQVSVDVSERPQASASEACKLVKMTDENSEREDFKAVFERTLLEVTEAQEKVRNEFNDCVTTMQFQFEEMIANNKKTINNLLSKYKLSFYPLMNLEKKMKKIMLNQKVLNCNEELQEDERKVQVSCHLNRTSKHRYSCLGTPMPFRQKSFTRSKSLPHLAIDPKSPGLDTTSSTISKSEEDFSPFTTLVGGCNQPFTPRTCSAVVDIKQSLDQQLKMLFD